MPKLFRWFTSGTLLFFIFNVLSFQASVAEAANWQTKVDPWVLTTAAEGETEFLIFMKEQVDLSPANAIKNKNERGAFVFEALTSSANKSQNSLQRQLNALGVQYKSYWIVNALWVRGDFDLVQKLAQRSDIAHIYANPQVLLSLPEQNQLTAPQSITGVEPNILQINADDLWGAGYRGAGVIIGGADTGYAWSHPALIRQYRGWNGNTVNHDYNWYDATNLSPTEPVDPYGHGTHTMGTMVGDDGGSNQIGVAPDAKWIGCRNMDNSGYGTPARYIECYQWFVAPTRIDGNNPRPDLAPDIINNSWGCPPSEGCTDPNILLTAVQNVNAAGILTVHSAGNSGYIGCGSVNQPAGIYAESFTVGAVDGVDTIASFSSRGPVTVDSSNRLKPNITAPGVSIRSSVPGDGYGYKQGTSMAAPHIVGVAALLISANPALAGQVGTLRTLIEETANPLYTNEVCGGDTATSLPNHTYGWGRVDAWGAYQDIPFGLLVNKSAPASVLPGEVLTYTLSVTNSHPFSTTHNTILTDTIPYKTAFISATGNYSVTGRLLTWNLGDLTAKTSEQVEFAIRVPESLTGTVKNEFYGAVSDEVSTPVGGEAVSTIIHQPALMWAYSTDCLEEWHFQGENHICALEISNMGNYTDTINLATAGGDSFVTPTMVTLGSSQSLPITLTISVPAGAAGGTEISTTVTATSMADSDVNESLDFTTWVYHQYFIPFVPKQ